MANQLKMAMVDAIRDMSQLGLSQPDVFDVLQNCCRRGYPCGAKRSIGRSGDDAIVSKAGSHPGLTSLRSAREPRDFEYDQCDRHTAGARNPLDDVDGWHP